MANLGEVSLVAQMDIEQPRVATEKLMNMLNKLGYEAGKGGQTLENAFRIDPSLDRTIQNINNGLRTSFDTLEEISRKNIGSIANIKTQMGALLGQIDSAEEQGNSKAVDYYENLYDTLESQLKVRTELQRVVQSQIKLQAEEGAKIKGATEQHVSLRTQLMKVRNEMGSLKLAGKENTAEYQQLRDKAEKLAKAQKELQKEMSVLGMKHPMMAGVIQGFQGLSGALSVATGFTGMLVGENEDMQKIMAKVQSMMAITIGLQQVQNSLDDDSAFKVGFLNKLREVGNVIVGKQAVVMKGSTVSIVANTAAATAGTKAVTGLSGAFKLLGSAIKKIPVLGWILAAVSAVVAVVSKIRGESKKIEEEEAEKQKAFQDKVAEGVARTISKVELLSEEWKKLNTLADKSKFVQQQASAFEELGVSINSVAEAENLLIKNKDKFIQAQIDKAIAAAITAQNEDKIKELAEDLREQEEKRIQEEEAKARMKKALESSKDSDSFIIKKNEGSDMTATVASNIRNTTQKVYTEDELLQKKIDDKMEELKKDYTLAGFYQDRSSEILSATNVKLKSGTNKTNKSVDIFGETLQMQIKNTTKEFENFFSTLKDGELAGNPFLELQTQLDILYTQLGEHKKELARKEITDEKLLAETIKDIDNETLDNKIAVDDKIRQWNQKQLDERKKQIEEQEKAEKDLYADLLLNYGTFQQQKKDISDKYTQAIALAEKKGNKQLVESLKKQMQKELGDRAGEYLQQMFSKAFSDEATMNDIKEAFAQIDELASKTTFDQTIAEKYGISKEDWDIIIAQAKKFKKELSQKVNIPIVNELKNIKESFAGGDITKAMDGIMKVADMAGGAVSYLAQTFRELADATGNVNLDKTATALEKVGTFMDNTGQGASVGASVGGGWGALIGAIIGSGIGVAKMWGESVQEQAEAQAKREQESVSAIEENTQTLLDTISAMNSLADTISSLDYGQFSTVIQDALNQLNSDISAYNSEQNWRNINNALQSVDFQKRQSLEREYVEWLKAMGYDISGYYDNNLTDTQATANMVNNLDYEHIQKLKELWRELSEFQRSGENDSLKLWNIQNKILLEKRNGLENEIAKYRLLGKDTSELENQLASLNLQIKTNIQTMVEGLLGIDLNGIIDNWIKIFEEFGNSSAMVFDKISSSVDDMVKNILKQQFLVKPLSRELQRIMEEADVDGDDELTYDEVRGVADRIGAFKESAYDLWESYREALEQAGINTEVAGTTLSSSIKGVSEETASIIAGQMNAIRVHQVEMLDIMRDNIAGNVQRIVDNTSHLITINSRLARMESYVQNSQYQRLL